MYVAFLFIIPMPWYTYYLKNEEEKSR